MGGGAVVGAGTAHALAPGEADDDHAVGEQEVEELEEGGFRASRAGEPGGEGAGGQAGQFAGLPEVAAVVEVLLQAAGDAAPVRRTNDQTIAGEEVSRDGLLDGAAQGFAAGVADTGLDGIGETGRQSSAGVIEEENASHRGASCSSTAMTSWNVSKG